jgi:hypothetical protein
MNSSIDYNQVLEYEQMKIGVGYYFGPVAERETNTVTTVCESLGTEERGGV